MNWLGCQAGHSTPSSGEVKNEWNYNSTGLYAFMAFIGTTLLSSV